MRPEEKTAFQTDYDDFVMENMDLVNGLDEAARNLINLHFGNNPTGRYHSAREISLRLRLKHSQILTGLRKVMMRLKLKARELGRPVPVESETPKTVIEVYGKPKRKR